MLVLTKFRVAVFGLALSLCACVSGPDPELEVRLKAWGQIDRETTATYVGDNRLRITTSSPFASDIHTLEGNILARAAGEAVRREAPRFGIVYVDYDDTSVGDLLLVPDYGSPSTEWIGSYEALLAARNQDDTDGSLKGRWGYRQMTVVVRLLAPGEDMWAEAFSSEEVYAAFLNDRIERRNIQPSKRFFLFQ